MAEHIYMLKQLLDYVDLYEEEVGNHNLKEFSLYLRDKLVNNETEMKKPDFGSEDFSNYKSYPEVEFSTLLTTLYRFARHYLKKAFQNTSFKTIDEFGFLATLLREKSLLKNELINKHLIEISSGSEILKRLIRNGMISEYPDKKDKRAKRVMLSKKGQEEILRAFEDMHMVSEIIIGNLSKNEVTEALSIFNKLSYFHHHVHDRDKQTSLTDLHQKYVEEKQNLAL
jgi:DNA-binding MarR family transcriptional regulator